MKVECTPEQATKAQRGRRGKLYSFFNLGAGWGGWSKPRPGRFTPGKDKVPIVEEAGRASGPVWTSAGNLTPTRIPTAKLFHADERTYLTKLIVDFRNFANAPKKTLHISHLHRF